MNTLSRPVVIRLARIPVPSLALLALAIAVSVFAAGAAWAEDYQQMLQQQDAFLQQQIEQSQAQMNATLAAGQQQVNQIVQQKMQDPQVQAAYQQHLQQAAQNGMQAYDFPTFAYYYAATNGFSQEGLATYRSNETANMAREQEAWRGYQNAQGAARAAIDENNAHFSNNMNEAGNQLMGNSTYVGETGSQVLPHTWQPNTYNSYQNHNYYVDENGQYWKADPNNTDTWYPLQQQPAGQ